MRQRLLLVAACGVLGGGGGGGWFVLGACVDNLRRPPLGAMQSS